MLQAWRGAALVMVVAIAQLGCVGASDESVLKAAQDALSRQDLKTAVVSLKELLQRNPDSPRARLLLGQAMTEAGDWSSAELELRKAKALGVAESSWAPGLAKSLLQQAKYKAVIDEFAATRLADAKAQADVMASVAAALVMTSQPDRAESVMAASLTAVPDHGPTLLLKVRLLSRTETLDQAFAILQQVLARQPGEVEALRMRGDLELLGRRDTKAADLSYAKVLELRPNDVGAHSARVYITLAQKRADEAKQRLAEMQKQLPGHPQTRLMAARVAFLGGEAQKARELLQQLLKIAPDNPMLLEFAGAVELQLNAPAQAEGLLGKAVAKAPGLISARLLLADALLRAGQPAKALEAIRTNLDRADGVDARSLTLAGEASLLLGEPARAEQFFRQAAKLAPADAKLKTALALLQLSRGQADAAYADLRSLAASVEDTLPDMTLISVQLRRGNAREALKAIDGLQRKEPNKPLAHLLRGNVLQSLREAAAARASYEQALKLDAKFLPAVQRLAAMDLAEGRVDAARDRFQALVQLDPNNATAMVGLAQIRSHQKAPADEVTKLYERAVLASPASPSVRLAQVHYFIDRRDIKAALAAAQAGVAAVPGNPELLDALGSTLFLSGDANQAILTFNKLAAMLPRSPKPHLRLADAYIHEKNYAQAEKSFRKALELAPNDLGAQRGLIALSVRARQLDRALEVAKDIQRRRPGESVGYLLEGDLHSEFNNAEAALKAYRTAGEIDGKGPAAEKYYHALVKLKGVQDADRFAADWLKKHPGNAGLILTLGSRALAAGNLAVAEKYFDDLVRIAPTSAPALNNLAWIRSKLGKPGALSLAESAVKLQPENPAILDTLAQVQANDGLMDKALTTSRNVLNLAPNEPLYRLSYARVLIKAGRMADAKPELEKLAALGAKFKAQAEVSELARQLK